MIPVAPAPEPPDFDSQVRQPGLIAIAEMVGKPPPYRRTAGKAHRKMADQESDIPAEHFPAYWTRALDGLMHAYRQTCAYACFRIHPVTGARSADHFAPKSRHWQDVYAWSNYRLCCSRMNARKNDFHHVLDPFLIQPNWFQLELLGFQVIPNFELEPAIADQIQTTIDTLGLNDFCREREEDTERYWAGDYSLRILQQESPFVAYELYRQNRLRAGDAWSPIVHTG